MKVKGEGEGWGRAWGRAEAEGGRWGQRVGGPRAGGPWRAVVEEEEEMEAVARFEEVVTGCVQAGDGGGRRRAPLRMWRCDP